MNKERPVIHELLVVEGLHDKQAVDEAVQADVWIVGGDRIAARFLQELKRASQTRGVIVLTDPDGPGERIRRRIEAQIPNCKHAFIRQKQALGHHRVGVEYATPDTILQAILNVRRVTSESSVLPSEFTIEDIQEAGLAGNKDSASRRKWVGDYLNIGYANAKSFLRKLNVLGITRAEWDEALLYMRKKGTNDDD